MSRERLRVTEKNTQDFISDLPHDLISDILSYLSTEDALRTSVLSRKWRYKWTSIGKFHIHDDYFGGTDGIKNFNRAVTRLLFRTQNFRLRSLSVLCHRDGHRACDFETWISEVLMRNIQMLEICALKIKGLHSPWCFSGWISLTLLTLKMSCTLKVPATNCFPKLKSLVLEKGGHGNIKIMTTKPLNTGGATLVFPVLENLRLCECEWLDVNQVEIQAPELIKFSNCSPWKLENYTIKIFGPKLDILELNGSVVHGRLHSSGHAEDLVLNASAVSYVSINTFVNNTSASQAHKILKKFTNLKCLRISGIALQALLSEPELVFPTFGRLKELQLNFNCRVKDMWDVLRLLPPLDSLIINVRLLTSDDSSGEALTPKIVSQLKKVKLLSFYGTRGQCDLVKYLFGNAMNLQEMTVNVLYENFLKGVGKILGEILSNLKLKGSSCELIVEQKDEMGKWDGLWPDVRMNYDSTTQIVFE